MPLKVISFRLIQFSFQLNLVIFFGSQQNIAESLTELLRIFTPYQQLISNYFSAQRSLKIQEMMICYNFCAETIMLLK